MNKAFNALTRQELAIIKRLSTPAKIQDYLNSIPINFEKKGETCMSPRRVLRQQQAHCLEGALFAAAALWYHGKRPLLLDLKASSKDFDHVVALFSAEGRSASGGKMKLWGAISKTNHAVLRYREPVYRTIRELALSYFHEYFNDQGVKTLRSHSGAFDLRAYENTWLIDEDELWDIGGDLDDAPHFAIVSPTAARTLRKADPIEIKAGKLTDYQ